MSVPPEHDRTKGITLNGPLRAVFLLLLLLSALLFAACIGIIRQGSLTIGSDSMGGPGSSYVVAPDQKAHQFWGVVVGTGGVASILLTIDLWLLVRHRRGKRRAG